MKLDVFQYNGRHYLRCIPAKTLMQSNLMYEVVTRGDQFAVELSTGKLTIIKGGEVVVDKTDTVPWSPCQDSWLELQDTNLQDNLF